MRDYYRELGVADDASAAELRRAYREWARRLHPDLNPADPEAGGAEGEAMRRLNEAWRVLADPAARRRYDEARTGGRASGDPVREGHDWAADLSVSGELRGRHRVRPAAWMVMVGILAAIFVFTAYAAGPAPTTPVPHTQADQCLAHFPGYDALVSCSQPNVGRVVTLLSPAANGSAPVVCPAGSAPQPVLGRAQIACLANP
jgi:hypothetical protein